MGFFLSKLLVLEPKNSKCQATIGLTTDSSFLVRSRGKWSDRVCGQQILYRGAFREKLQQGRDCKFSFKNFPIFVYFFHHVCESNLTDKPKLPLQVLRWITAELFNVYSSEMKEVYWNFSAIKNLFRQVNPSRVQAVSDLRDDDSIYSTEKALLLMFDK